MATIISSKTTSGGGLIITPDTSGILALASADGTTAVTIDASQNTSLVGNLNLTGASKFITGDFSNSTVANRVAFQTSTTNGNTGLTVLPNGTATYSGISLFSNSNPTNSSYGALSQNGTTTKVEASINGTGTYGNLELWSGGVRTFYSGSSGDVHIPALNIDGGYIELNSAITVDSVCFIDFHATAGSDFNFRILRNAGVNGATQLQNTGTGAILVTANTAGVQLTNGATSWVSASDENRKDIIEPIINGVDKVATLRSVIGKYKTDDADKRRVFLIAQDVQKVLPEAVVECEDDTGKYLALSYTDIVPLLVSAINELTARVKVLESKIV
jgi:hypothetical protein